ncbi:hypothetical protein NLU13_5260 [Sarocladium strictum]|uniref:Uncharacterized protein n=1 Tax=Sarocladium strictum TaxID=5046 RepID=A0AA39GGJ0_SARSR|nr:hypothetical protein NLU13_5260 [Sarocladium strictum]
MTEQRVSRGLTHVFVRQACQSLKEHEPSACPTRLRPNSLTKHRLDHIDYLPLVLAAKMTPSYIQILQRAVRGYEADLKYYETLFKQNQELLYSTDPKHQQEALNFSVHLMETIDKLRDEKIPNAKKELQEQIDEEEEHARKEKGKKEEAKK